MRKKQPGPPPAIQPLPNNDIITQVREYELITPLFGGGVIPGEADPITIVRGTEIRGHLRFWWRATRGGQFNGDLGAMKDEEDKLWGKAYSKGDKPISQNEVVQITVEPTNLGEIINPADRRFGIPPYAAFPLLEGQNGSWQLRSGVTFKLTLTFPSKIERDIDAALWAWETFGGIGARTRRGFGAVHLLKVDGNKVPDIDKNVVPQWIRSKLNDETVVARGKNPPGLPHLSPNTIIRVVLRPPNASPKDSWAYMINTLKNFRQSRSKGQTGRSNWPEAEAVRDITGHRNTRLYKQLGHPRKFPRAVFGLPIVFHFKDERAGDPLDTTLKGRYSERLASPLILRPFMCSSGQSVGLALLLEGSSVLPEPLILERLENATRKQYAASAEALTSSEAQRIPVLNGQTEVLIAFMNYLGGNNR